MKISVERHEDNFGQLVFTITCRDAHDVPFDSETMRFLDQAERDIRSLGNPTHKLTGEVLDSLHAHKEKAFYRMKKNIQFAIDNDLKNKWTPVSQEIYNWIYDKQAGETKKWMETFDVERARYYFDNDLEVKNDCPVDCEDDDDN